MATDVDDSSLANTLTIEPKSDNYPSLNPRPNMSGMDQSMAIANSWVAYLPLEDTLGKRYKNLELHLRQFSIPQIEMGSMEVASHGYSKQMSTGVLNAGTKEITLSYLIDEYWQNYKSLWAWCQAPVGTVNPLTDDKSKFHSANNYLTMRIYLMNNYKQKIVQFEFLNVWIRVFNELQLDVTNQDQLEHSFTVCYDSMSMVES